MEKLGKTQAMVGGSAAPLKSGAIVGAMRCTSMRDGGSKQALMKKKLGTHAGSSSRGREEQT